MKTTVTLMFAILIIMLSAAAFRTEYAIELVNEVKKLSVKIPAGIDTGSTLRIKGEGEAVKNGNSGDLFLVIQLLHLSSFQILQQFLLE